MTPEKFVPYKTIWRDFFIIFQILMSLFVSGNAIGEEGFVFKGETFHTRYTVIYFKSQTDLNIFEKKLKYRPEKSRRQRPFDYPVSAGEAGISDIDTAVTAGKKVDSIFERVQQILDMKKTFDKVNVYLHTDRKHLNDSYYRLYGEKCSIRAWYIYELNAVFLNLNDLHEGILAHELAHAIIDHYLEVRPPPSSAEILARYVDAHLKR